MPIIKPVSGHTGCAGVRRYLIRQDRALGADYLNLDTENMPQEREALSPSIGRRAWTWTVMRRETTFPGRALHSSKGNIGGHIPFHDPST